MPARTDGDLHDLMHPPVRRVWFRMPADGDSHARTTGATPAHHVPDPPARAGAVTAMARFRLFGRPTPTEPQYPPATGGWHPGVPHYPAPGIGWSGAATPRRPVPHPRAGGMAPVAGRVHTRTIADLEPPTDPYGFPPITLATAEPPASGTGVRPAQPDPAEAAALAGAFAVDYLSWDEDDPARRGRVLRDYLRPPTGDPALLGWSGQGRQRGEFALPGLVRSDGEARVLVDVRVRVTPYRAVGDRTADPAATTEPEPGVAGVPAVAPAPTGRGWRGLASYWVRLSVPVALEGGRLLIDAWEETLADALVELDPEPGPGPAAALDHALVDDDPLAGGAP